MLGTATYLTRVVLEMASCLTIPPDRAVGMAAYLTVPPDREVLGMATYCYTRKRSFINGYLLNSFTR